MGTFYAYDQNNSGGVFNVDDQVTYTVIIEADSADDADKRAEEVGIYFDGCAKEIDCDCCGDRWHTAWGEGTATPMIYSVPAEEFDEHWGAVGQPVVYIYYMDGTKKTIYKKESK